MEQEKEIKPFQNPDLVVLRNPVAKAKFGLSLVQQKFLFEVLAFFKSQPDLRMARFNVREYFSKLGISSNNLREYVREVEEMRRFDIKIPTGDNEKGVNFIGVTLFASVEYKVGDNKSGYIEVEVSDKLKPYFLEIAKGDFFYYHILNTRVLKSTYSIKLYLLLKSYARLGRLEMKFDELKGILEVDKDTYKQYPDFKKRVLDRARSEMREKNDICFEYQEIRQFPQNSKSPVVGILFQIFENPDYKAPSKPRLEIPKKVEKKATKKTAKLDFVEFEQLENPPKTSYEKSVPEASVPQGEESEIIEMFRHFDRESDNAFVLEYVNGLRYPSEAVLDALHYARKQGNVKNIYAYLPAILKGKAGHGMAEKSRREKQIRQKADENKRQLAALSAEYNDLLDSIEGQKRNIIREIVAEVEGATESVVEAVKRKYRGSFGIQDETPVGEFREKPFLRSLVMHEFRAIFPEAFDGVGELRNLENRLDALKKQAKAIDANFVF